MTQNEKYKFFDSVKTKSGLAGDEVGSALQKSIRRGWEEKACEFAYEMYITSPYYLEKLWQRLLTISVEDIGMGNREAMPQIYCLNEIRKNYQYNDVDQPIFFIHAIRLLCESEKDRSSDILKNIMIKSFAMGYKPEIPDIALDKHTKRGRAMGRDSFHFLNEASQVFPQAEITNDYKERYAEILKKYDPNNVDPDAFKFDL